MIKYEKGIKMKNLVVCGCSFTHGHLLSTDQTWGKFVADKKKWNFYNIAQGGVGNEWISYQTIGFLESNKHLKKDAVVMIAWSESGRLLNTFQYNIDSELDYQTVRPADFGDGHFRTKWDPNVEYYHGYVLKHGKILEPFFRSSYFGFMKTYFAIFNLKNYLELNNIPYIFFDAVGSNRINGLKKIDKKNLSYYTRDTEGNYIQIEEKSPMDRSTPQYLDPSKELGKTIFDDKFINFNGSTSMLEEIRKKNFNFYTNGNDGHPNLNACEYFSNLIIEKFDSLYKNVS
jgi:hypothetical protein